MMNSNSANADSILAKAFRQLVKVKKLKSILADHFEDDSSIPIVASMEDFVHYVEEKSSIVDSDVEFAAKFQASLEQKYQAVMKMVVSPHSDLSKCMEIVSEDIK